MLSLRIFCMKPGMSMPVGHAVVHCEEACVRNTHEAKAEEDCIVFILQFSQREVLTQRDLVTYFNTTDGKDVLDFALRKIVYCLVCGDAVFVQPAEFSVAIKYDG